MKALILAGGKGTRLRPLTVYTPKPIVPVVNRPFLLYQIEILRRAGIEDITLSLNYQPDKIRHLLGDGGEFGVNIDYVTEPQPMGTAGAYKYAVAPEDGPTIVLNGDILTDMVVKRVIDAHKDSGAAATICLAEVEDASSYGLVRTDTALNVTSFVEKPDADQLATESVNHINAGVYILEPSVLDLIQADANCSFEYEVFPKLLENESAFKAHVLEDEYWCDIGTPEKYLQAHMDFLGGRIRRFDIERETEDGEIATAASVDGKSVIADNCIIKPNAVIRNSVIGEGVQIEERAVIENSVIWPHTHISNNALVSGAVIAKSCYIGKNARVTAGSVLGDKSSLTDYTSV
ncbi:MAG: NDP-sugar synthase [Pyrinomonadaceae bacterium]